MIHLLVYLLFILLLLGNISLILISQDKSSVLDYLVKSRWYFPYHVFLTTYLLPLGEYGRHLRQKSFINLRRSSAPMFMGAIDVYKPKLFSQINEASGKVATETVTVLEIGIGPGNNFQYYPAKCDLHVVEPVSSYRKEIDAKLENYPGIHLKGFYTTSAEQMSMIPEETVDVVIGTFVLCSAEDNQSVLQEIRRVLKPGGKYYYIEHVKSPTSWKRYIQEILKWTKVWNYWMCGCDFYNTESLIRNAGFADVSSTEAQLKYSQFMLTEIFVDHIYFGVATK